MQERAYRAAKSASDEMGLLTDVFYRQYDLLFRLTTQMLATAEVQDRLSLVLDAVTFELGYPHAAIAIIDNDTGVLQLRMGLGFPNDDALTSLPIPQNLGISFGDSRMKWRPVWIMRSNSASDAKFLDHIQCAEDLLGLPLFGGQWLSEPQPDPFGAPAMPADAL